MHVLWRKLNRKRLMQNMSNFSATFYRLKVNTSVVEEKKNLYEQNFVVRYCKLSLLYANESFYKHAVYLRRWLKWHAMTHFGLWQRRNLSRIEACTVPQMIPNRKWSRDRKWSSTASDPQSRPQMIPWKLEEWNGFCGTDYKKGLIIKKKPFSLAF